MKVLTFGELEKFEELAIAKYLGENIFLYKPANPMYRKNFIKVGEAEFDEDTNIYVEDLGDTLARAKPYYLFVFDEFDKDDARYDTEFINYVESNQPSFPNIHVVELKDDIIFRIILDDYDSMWEVVEYLDMPEWFKIKDGKKVAAF